METITSRSHSLCPDHPNPASEPAKQMTKGIRLTKFAKRGGCAAKQPPGFLFSLLPALPAVSDPNVLVGSSTADDAAVYKLNDDLALVLTTDFFTPIVDDPADFGAIAAANALSDVYAMGGRPLAALSIVGFPESSLGPDVLVSILNAASKKSEEAGIAIIGGHTIKSEEPVFGLAVIGRVHPAEVLTNATAVPGDALVLTKPLGLGIISTAAKNGECEPAAMNDAIAVMKTLNRRAGEILIESRAVHALTDVTGFGLLGHLRNMTVASKVAGRIWLDHVPVLEPGWELARRGIAPGGSYANRRFLEESVEYGPELGEAEQLVLCDAQTSGGLLAAVAADKANAVVAQLRSAGVVPAAIIGRIEATGNGLIRVDRHKPD